jgi:integrase
MPRQKYQRPEVYLAGKREKVWKAEYREYYIGPDGKEHSRHKSAVWNRADHTKAEAQQKCDALMAQLRDGGPHADGSMTLEQFWDQIYYPVRSGRWEYNTRSALCSAWKRHIKEPGLGAMKLQDITKANIELQLVKLADSGLALNTLKTVKTLITSLLEEAHENDYIRKNPAKRVQLPRCKPTEEVRSLTLDEARRLLAKTQGRDYIMFRILLLAGPRICELLALERADLLPDALRIDESISPSGVKCTKNRKVRIAPIPESLHAELVEWLGTHENRLMFPSVTGKIYRRASKTVNEILPRARAATGIKDLTFRMCRTTFATLFDGNIRDAQEILGHHSEEFTRKHYQKAISERAAAAVDDLDRKLKVIEMPKKKVG